MNDAPPKSVKILGKRYAIKVIKGGDVLGLSDNTRNVLSIRDGQNWQQLRDSLLHEIVHSIEYSAAIELEERQVHALGCCLYQLIAENPTLMRWIEKRPAK